MTSVQGMQKYCMRLVFKLYQQISKFTWAFVLELLLNFYGVQHMLTRRELFASI